MLGGASDQDKGRTTGGANLADANAARLRFHSRTAMAARIGDLSIAEAIKPPRAMLLCVVIDNRHRTR